MKKISFLATVIFPSALILCTSCTSTTQVDSPEDFPDTSFQDTVSDLPDIDTVPLSSEMLSVNADALQNVTDEQGVLPVRK